MPRHPQPTVPRGREQVLAALRGTGGRRQPVDRAWCGGLREHLQDELAETVVDEARELPRTIGWRDLAVPATGAPPVAELLARTMFRQWVTVGAGGDPLDDVVDALRAAGDADSIIRAVRRLSPTARRALADRLCRHAGWLRRHWPPLDPRWAPVTGELRLLPLAGGSVLAGARTDLALGLPAARRASRCLVAATDGAPTAPGPWQRLRLAALAEALATGAPPFRLVVVAPASGALATVAVDRPMLWETAAAVVRAARQGTAPAAEPDPAGAAAERCTALPVLVRASRCGPVEVGEGNLAGGDAATGGAGGLHPMAAAS